MSLNPRHPHSIPLPVQFPNIDAITGLIIDMVVPHGFGVGRSMLHGLDLESHQ